MVLVERGEREDIRCLIQFGQFFVWEVSRENDVGSDAEARGVVNQFVHFALRMALGRDVLEDADMSSLLSAAVCGLREGESYSPASAVKGNGALSSLCFKGMCDKREDRGDIIPDGSSSGDASDVFRCAVED